ncbi:MAG: ABC transporter ATP-binding protein/permease [Clostridiales bacterium]|jgi:ATP-binding cassette subfamily B protein|nr:ABC transporter ATP-binding protein/permease [Clostridiales bacterium]
MKKNQDNNSSLKVFLRLLSYSYKFKALFFWAVIFSLISVIFSVIGPLIVSDAVKFMTGDNFLLSGLLVYVKRLAVIYLFAAAFNYAYGLLTNILTQNTIRNIRDELFTKLSKMPVKFLDQNKTGVLIGNIINDVETVGEGMISNITLLFMCSATVCVTLVSMFILDPIIALIVVCLTPLALLTAYSLSKLSKRYFSQTQKNLGLLNAVSNEMISGQKIVKAYLYEETAKRKFAETNDALYSTSVKSQFLSSMVNPLVRYIGLFTYISVGIFCVFFSVPINITTAFLMYSNQYARPFTDITSVITQLQSAIAAAERIFSVLNEKEDTEDRENAVTLNNFRGDVVFDNVDFSYSEDKPLIKGFSLSVSKGQKIAIVGPTGSGKTTLVNLLMRFYDVDGGAIFLDGYNVKDIKRESLHRAFGMVLQDAYLFTGTIKENIAYGKEGATEEEIIEAAKNADCYDFVTNLKDGFDTIISDGLMNISKGQKQLIFIARIMLNIPPLLILDEATSSIDTYIEMRIKNVFDSMMKGRTSFVVAHRLSTILNADLILVMNNGNVIEKGSHKELMDKNGFYRKLYDSQYSVSANQQ